MSFFAEQATLLCTRVILEDYIRIKKFSTTMIRIFQTQYSHVKHCGVPRLVLFHAWDPKRLISLNTYTHTHTHVHKQTSSSFVTNHILVPFYPFHFGLHTCFDKAFCTPFVERIVEDIFPSVILLLYVVLSLPMTTYLPLLCASRGLFLFLASCLFLSLLLSLSLWSKSSRQEF